MTEVWTVLLVALALTQASAIATSVYLHRALAHRSLALHPVADVVLRAGLWLTTGQDRRQWVAVHRKHHAFTDREGDPHSPRLLGFWHVQFLNADDYAREARDPRTIERVGRRVVEVPGTTITTRIQGHRSSAPDRSNSIRCGRSSGCWRPSGSSW